MGNLEHSTPFLTIIFLVMSAVIIGCVLLAQRGRSMYIRRIPGLSAIEDAVGRATEMGKPIYFSTGLGGIDITTLQALTILTHVVRAAAAQATRVIVGTADPTLMPVAEESVREAYTSVGRQALYRAEDVRFVSGDQFAYALGSVGIMARERTATNFYFGYFAAEALILTENGRALGSLQVAGCPDPTQIPFFIAHLRLCGHRRRVLRRQRLPHPRADAHRQHGGTGYREGRTDRVYRPGHRRRHRVLRYTPPA